MKIASFMAGVMLVAAAVVSSAPVPVSAAGPDFCRDYARAAVRQAHTVRESRFCARVIPANPARWTERYAVHFEWCRGAPAPEANAERAARRIHLQECRH